jgi:hypothetical protein
LLEESRLEGGRDEDMMDKGKEWETKYGRKEGRIRRYEWDKENEDK